MLIRPFRPDDAEALVALFHASVHGIGVRDYSPEQVRAWSPSPPDPERFRRHAQGRQIFVAQDAAGDPLGYGTLEADGHIDHLYCRPDAAGTGVGSALCDAIEAAARGDGISRLYTEASEAARRLLERRGFSVDSRNDFSVNGVAIHNYRMSKAID